MGEARLHCEFLGIDTSSDFHVLRHRIISNSSVSRHHKKFGRITLARSISVVCNFAPFYSGILLAEILYSCINASGSLQVTFSTDLLPAKSYGKKIQRTTSRSLNFVSNNRTWLSTNNPVRAKRALEVHNIQSIKHRQAPGQSSTFTYSAWRRRRFLLKSHQSARDQFA